MNQVNEMAEESEEVVFAQDLDTFVAVLTDWHQAKVAMLQHMCTIPEGSQCQIGVEESALVTLEGDYLEGFKLGITLSLMELGQLPFVTEEEDEPEPASA